MTPKPICIAQISDLHIKPPGTLAYGKVDTGRALERCVASLNAFDPAPDFVVISGDLADTPNVEEYDYLKRLLEPLKLPFAGIPGNHDSRELMRAAFPDAPYAASSLQRSIRPGAGAARYRLRQPARIERADRGAAHATGLAAGGASTPQHDCLPGIDRRSLRVS